jgi:hypothetical protein
MEIRQKLLSIQIPTTIDRRDQFVKLHRFIENQIIGSDLVDLVELIWLEDNKEISIGKKRDILYKISSALYSVQIDSDDWLADDFVTKVTAACSQGKDCVVYKESVTVNGENKGDSLFSRDFKGWLEKLSPQINNCTRVRTPFHKTPILTQICVKTGVRDMRFGEDQNFSKRVLPFLKTQTYIDEIMYKYRYVNLNETHNQRYGIR